MNLYNKRYNTLRAAWIFRCRNRRLTQDLATAMREFEPVRNEKFQIVVFCSKARIREIESYIALNGFVEEKKVEQLYQVLSK